MQGRHHRGAGVNAPLLKTMGGKQCSLPHPHNFILSGGNWGGGAKETFPIFTKQSTEENIPALGRTSFFYCVQQLKQKNSFIVLINKIFGLWPDFFYLLSSIV